MFMFQCNGSERRARIIEPIIKAALLASNANSGIPIYVYHEQNGSGVLVAVAKSGNVEIQCAVTLDGSLFTGD